MVCRRKHKSRAQFQQSPTALLPEGNLDHRPPLVHIFQQFRFPRWSEVGSPHCCYVAIRRAWQASPKIGFQSATQIPFYPFHSTWCTWSTNPSYKFYYAREHRHNRCLPIIFPLFPLPCSVVPLFLARSSVVLIAAARTKETQTVVPLPLALGEPDELSQWSAFNNNPYAIANARLLIIFRCFPSLAGRLPGEQLRHGFRRQLQRGLRSIGKESFWPDTSKQPWFLTKETSLGDIS